MRSGSWNRSADRAGVDAGFAMAALLVSLAVMSILLAMALPAWRHAAQREREAELIFRGEQYARAILLFQRQTPGAFPPDLEALVDGRFLRRAYPDPMTEDGVFRLIPQSEVSASGGGETADAERTGDAESVTEDAETADTPGGVEGGIAGVVSRSTAFSIAQYNGGVRYDEWRFLVSESEATDAPTLSP